LQYEYFVSGASRDHKPLRLWVIVSKEKKEEEMITMEVKNGSASRVTARGYGDLV
jgi:hypothetical protein